MVKILTWNVNSIRTRIQHLEQVVNLYSPDIMLLQETKCINDNFPTSAVEDLGYNIAIHGQKAYNGVAILSKTPLEDVKMSLIPNNEEARYIEAFTFVENLPLRVVSVYVPHGTEVDSERFRFKLQFLEALKEKMMGFKVNHDELSVIGGDLNVAPEEIDVYNPKHLNGKPGFHIEERKRMREIINCGFYDSFRLMNQHEQKFSWWDYRSGGFNHNKGMRIDHLLISPNTCDKLKSAGIYTEPRGWDKPSDHTPVFVEIA